MKLKMNLLLATLLVLVSCMSEKQPHLINSTFEEKAINSTDKLGISVSNAANRKFSYTNKAAAYWYAKTHHNTDDMWYAGWNVATKRILNDYQISINDTLADRFASNVFVYPDRVERVYPKGLTEKLWMLDNIDVILWDLKAAEKDQKLTWIANPTLLKKSSVSEKGLILTPKESEDHIILVAPKNDIPFELDDFSISTNAKAEGFLAVYAPNLTKAEELLTKSRTNIEELKKLRTDRINHLIESNAILTNDESLNKAFPYLLTTTDQLITKQMGWGIYAGLPWFNDYWGRDMFISMPGATLVNGQCDKAAKVISSFVKYQNLDKESRLYGRIPNRARPDEIIYNTTDGTPRLIHQMMDYVRYTGDYSYLKDWFPAVEASIEGAIKNWVDKDGLLAHEDADTWMDAKKNGKMPYSPRGTKANDIQALWYQQLVDGSQIASLVGRDSLALDWKKRAQAVRAKVQQLYLNDDVSYLADHINEDGSLDTKLRPNQLFVLDMIDDSLTKASITKTVWEELVYPWGVASLAQSDQDFHPYHENWHFYHKDEAYHNGTVWVWNNGAAMQRMLEFGQSDIAYTLFKNMTDYSLHKGAVGSLSENFDALPKEGEDWAAESGTFLQAWSNAEYQRVWYQFFLGVKPNMQKQQILLKPQIPTALKAVTQRIPVYESSLSFVYKNDEEGQSWEYEWDGPETTFDLNIAAFENQNFVLKKGDVISCMTKSDALHIILFRDGEIVLDKMVAVDPLKEQIISQWNTFFEGTTFCEPKLNKNLKSLSNYHKVPLTY